MGRSEKPSLIYSKRMRTAQLFILFAAVAVTARISSDEVVPEEAELMSRLPNELDGKHLSYTPEKDSEKKRSGPHASTTLLEVKAAAQERLSALLQAGNDEQQCFDLAKKTIETIQNERDDIQQEINAFGNTEECENRVFEDVKDANDEAGKDSETHREICQTQRTRKSRSR